MKKGVFSLRQIAFSQNPRHIRAMNSNESDGKAQKPAITNSKKLEKEARLAKALRDNLRRRKAANPSIEK